MTKTTCEQPDREYCSCCPSIRGCEATDERIKERNRERESRTSIKDDLIKALWDIMRNIPLEDTGKWYYKQAEAALLKAGWKS